MTTTDDTSLPSAPTAAVRATLAEFRVGSSDPTTRLGPSSFCRATLTPDGPGTVLIRWGPHGLDACAWGPGSGWLVQRVDAITGAFDCPQPLPSLHPVVTAAEHRHPDVRFGASGTLYHELLPIILAQRITGGEATHQWHRLVRTFGTPAPGPLPGMLVPPSPQQLAGTPAWRLHPLGIEAKRANALRTVARHADRLWEWAEQPAGTCARNLALLPGIGEWTVGCAVGLALGCADSIAVGDFHLKNVVVHALTGRPRGTDDEMVALLEPYRPQRRRVTRLLQLDGHSAPKFGPRRRILHIHRW
jgi:3-methyladenine DNA glycosylase/8-oxoguanine DNA glycosylase